MREKKTKQKKVLKDVLLYLDGFDENNLFDFEYNNKLLYAVSEVLRSEKNRRGVKFNLNFCDDAILNLIDLIVKIADKNEFKKPGILQEIKKPYHGVLQYENDSGRECEPFEYYDYDVLSEYSDTGEIIGSR